jgi:hypothetical protein
MLTHSGLTNLEVSLLVSAGFFFLRFVRNTYIHCVGLNVDFLMINLMVLTVNSRLEKNSLTGLKMSHSIVTKTK